MRKTPTVEWDPIVSYSERARERAMLGERENDRWFPGPCVGLSGGVNPHKYNFELRKTYYRTRFPGGWNRARIWTD